MMAGALGMAAAENKLSVGYGAEAGDMDADACSASCEKNCKNSFVLCRNEPSRKRARRAGHPQRRRHRHGLDVRARAARARARSCCATQGWDGETPVLAVVSRSIRSGGR